MRSLHFLNVVPFFADNVPFMAENAVRIAKETGLTNMTCCISLHPEGKCAWKKAEMYAKSFAELKQRLADHPEIRVGILIQSIMGHGWSGSVPLTEEPWQRTVSQDGAESSRMCFIGKDFQEYILKAIGELAKSEPAFFLVDDDFCIKFSTVSGEHGPECYCPMHMAEYNRRLNANYNREELVEYLQKHDWQDPIVKTVGDVLYDGLVDFAKKIRGVIDKYAKPGTRCGMCCPGAGHYRLADIACALAGDTEPFVRVANAIYCSSHPYYAQACTQYTCIRINAVKDRVKDIIDESDTFPQSIFSESARSLNTHITNGILHGLNGGKLWITNFENPDTEQGLPYERIIAKNYGLYNTLLQTLDAGIQWYGPVTPLADTNRRYHPMNQSDALCFDDFIAEILYRFGVPANYGRPEESDGPYMLSGSLAEKFTDDEIRKMFTKSVLLDSTAVKHLTERGFSSLMGVKAGTRNDFFFTSEKTHEASAERCGLMWDNDMAELVPVSDKVRVESDLSWVCMRKEVSKDSMAGMTVYENELGGKCVCLAWPVRLAYYKLTKPSRKRVFLYALKQLMGDKMPIYLANMQEAELRHGKCSDGYELLSIISLNIDPLCHPRLVSNRMPVSVERLSGEGEWYPVSFFARKEKQEIELAESLDLHVPAVYRMKF